VTAGWDQPLVFEVDYNLDDIVEFQDHRRKRLTGWLRWAPLVICAVVFVMLALMLLPQVISPQDHAGSVGSGVVAALIPMTPAIVVYVVIFVLLLRKSRGALQHAFSRPGNLNRHHTFAMDANGVGVREPLYWGHYGWPAILRWAETRGLFILHYAELDALILPKRCLAGREDQVRQMLRLFVDQRTVAAMPVSGASAVPPPLPRT